MATEKQLTEERDLSRTLAEEIKAAFTQRQKTTPPNWADDAWLEDARHINSMCLKLFEDELMENGLKPKTVRNHVFNVEIMGDYFVDYDGRTFIDGFPGVDMFFGYYFIRKCMWSTPGTVKSTAASVKKLYKCLHRYGIIDNSVISDVLETIKQDLPDWQTECGAYNNDDFY